MGVIFDLDGTLLDDIPLAKSIHQKLAEINNITLSNDLNLELSNKVGEILSQSGSNFERMKLLLYIGKSFKIPWYKRLKIFKQVNKLFKENITKCPIFEGVEETLGYLINKGIKIGINTSSSDYEIRLSFKGRMKFLDYFNGNILSKNDIKHLKPSPEALLRFSKKWNIPPNNLVMIGDSPLDIMAAKNAGAISVGVLCGFGTREILKNVGAEFIINQVSNLPSILPEIENRLQ